MLRAPVISLLLVAQVFHPAQQSSVSGKPTKREEVVALVVAKEIAAGKLEERGDGCVGLGGKLGIRPKTILAELHGKGLKLHDAGWCNDSPRGIVIKIVSPVKEGPVGFDITAEVVDLDPIRKNGEHFGTLLRGGTYSIHYEDGYEPRFERYEQYCCSGIIGREKVEEFCSGFTAAAEHSPQCDEFVVHDPGRVENLKIPHKPAYHTYSRWEFEGQIYILAYRDVDHHPMDMVVDVYLSDPEGYKRIGGMPVYDLVRSVSVMRLTGDAGPDFVFETDTGQLKSIFVLLINKGKATKVFEYGASRMRIVDGEKPKIVAESWLANSVQEFAWDEKAQEFREVRSYRLRKAK